MKTDIVKIDSLNPLKPYITFENQFIVIFEFPIGVMGNFYSACLYALKFFTDIEVITDNSLRYALKVTCRKRNNVPLISDAAKIEAAIKVVENELKQVQNQIRNQKLLN